MIAHQGSNVIIGSLFQPTSGTFNLADYEVKLTLSDIQGNTILAKTTDIIRNDADNVVACTIKGSETKALNGLYFVTFELWANGEKVLSNEVEQLTIIK